jgi:hypothetical protein
MIEISIVDPRIHFSSCFAHSTTDLTSQKFRMKTTMTSFFLFGAFSRPKCLILRLAWVKPSYTHYSRDEFPRIGIYACG